MSERQEFSNPSFHLIVHRKANCVIEYEVNVFAPLCIAAQKKAAQSVGKELTIPGFRKGKAPSELVSKHFPGQLAQKWHEELANLMYGQCAAITQIPLNQKDTKITFNMHSCSIEGARLSLFFETTPVIPLIDPATCVLKPVKGPEVSKQKVEETLRQTLLFFAKWTPVEGRPIKEGDFLLLNIDILETNPPERLFTSTRFEVTPGSMARWMRSLVIGKQKGDIIEGVSMPDDDLSEEDKKLYTPKKARLTILEVETATIPELTSDLLQKLKASSEDDLKNKIESLLERKAKEAVRLQKREQIANFLLSHPFDLPSSAIEKEVRYRFEQIARTPQFKETWDKSNEKERADLIGSVKSQAERAVRMFYLCHRIAEAKEISISPRDLAQPITDPLEMLLYPPQSEAQAAHSAEMRQAEAYSKVLLEKTEDWVLAHAQESAEEPLSETDSTEKKKPSSPVKEDGAKPKRKRASPPPLSVEETSQTATSKEKKKSTPKKTSSKP